jgi:hypothetical protein
MAQITVVEVLKRYGAELLQGNASLFAGAGLSRPSGFVDWKTLLEEIASDLGLDISRETDLLAIAQFHVNERTSRARLNQLLIEEFNKDAKLSENHKLIASMNLRSIWTTNYDELIETSFKAVKKRPDVKTTTANLAQSLPGRDVVIYKMHGDCNQPQSAVLTKEDYEVYEETRGAFSTVLKGELIERTFLFLGFSFTDPNIEYILSRIRGLLGQNQRDHYCVMKWPDAPSSPTEQADYEYNRRKLELRIKDLERYRIHTLMIDSYGEITELLKKLSLHVHSKDVFVSGSAVDYGPLGQVRVENLLRKLGSELIRRGFNLVSGFGLGIGSTVAYGALSEVYTNDLSPDRIRLLPFPQSIPASVERAAFFTQHRESMISLAGFSIFVCGNRVQTDSLEMAPGVYEEFAITWKNGKFPIPIGATGWAAERIWNEVAKEPQAFFGTVDVSVELLVLKKIDATDNEYLEAIFAMFKKLNR